MQGFMIDALGLQRFLLNIINTVRLPCNVIEAQKLFQAFLAFVVYQFVPLLSVLTEGNNL
jgi:hypothetical protein